ncbi:MAG: DUF5916 domain-containing protein [Gemmatimonadota bacterium]
MGDEEALALAPCLALWSEASAQARQETAGSGSVPADTSRFVAQIRPVLNVTRRAGPIKIDGDLDDEGWRDAARATGFSENFPTEKGRPPVGSQVLVTYDESHLYLAFIAEDDPGTIRASLSDRDEMWQDDYFSILLDTYGDASWAYFLFANPLGVQGDSRFATTGGEDDGFNIIYHSEGKITPNGYQIEMSIPFASLRFPDRPTQEWRATFWRTRPRGSRATYTWAAMDRDESCFLCQFGTLRGFEGIKSGGALDLLPTVIASQAGALKDPADPTSGIHDDGMSGELSLGATYSFASGLTADAAVNPDFSQVESDVAQIDVNTTFALFFPERRPFFQEGADLFSTFIDAVYTRSINDPQAATKLTGRMGRTSLAYIGARDAHSPILIPFEERSFLGQGGKSITNIFRGRRTFGSDSYIGALITDRRLEGTGGSGTVAGADGTLRFLDNYRLEWQVLASRTREPDDADLTAGLEGVTFDRGAHTAAFDGESFWGSAQYGSLRRSARMWNFNVSNQALNPTFRTDNGFETRNDSRRVSAWNGLSFWPEASALFDQIQPSLFASRTWNFDGVRKRDALEPQIWMQLKAQTGVNFWYDFGRERFRDVEFEGIRRWGLFVNSRFSDPVKLGFFLSHGKSIARNLSTPILGDGTDAEIFATFKPTNRLVIEPSVNVSSLSHPNGGPEIFSGYILRTRTNFQFPFTLFFVGSSLSYRDFDDPRASALTQTGRQVFAKFQYLLRM